MDKFLYENEEPKERLNSLQNTADKVDEKRYYKKLSAEEISSRRKDFTDKSLTVSDLEEQKKETINSFKNQITPIKDEVKHLGTEIRTGYAQHYGKLFGFIDQNTKMVYFYSESGELIETETRPANQDELGLFSDNVRKLRTGTHD